MDCTGDHERGRRHQQGIGRLFVCDGYGRGMSVMSL